MIRRLAIVALLVLGWFAAGWLEQGTPAPGAAATTGEFRADGPLPGNATGPEPGVPFWASWCGHDDNRGRLAFGPFPAPARLRLWLRGYPAQPGNALFLENVATGERWPLAADNVGESWVARSWEIPAAWRGVDVRLVAVDDAAGWGGWFALTAPVAVSSAAAWWSGYPGQLHAFAYAGLVLALLAAAMRRAIVGRLGLPPALTVGLSLTGVFLASLVTAIVLFVSPAAGRALAFALLAAALVSWIIGDARRPGRRTVAARLAADAAAPAVLMALIGLAYFSILLLYTPESSLSLLPGQRFLGRAMSDNEIPPFYARLLWTGGDCRTLYGDWQSSDRPPLGSTWIALAAGPLAALGGNFEVCAQAAGLWMQLAWIPAAWGWLRLQRVGRRGAWWIVATAAACGLLLFNSVYIWPKLAAAAAVLLAAALWLHAGRRRAVGPAAGACLAAGWLAHGGIAFALLGFAPFALARVRRLGWRAVAGAGLAAALLVAPWTVYQRHVDPPGNRLLKWHLAGVIAPDARGTGETIVSAYRDQPAAAALAARRENLKLVAMGTWSLRLAWPVALGPWREGELQYYAASLGWWLPAAALALAAWLVRRRPPAADIAGALVWTLLSLAAWIALMFLPATAINHQGTYLFQLVPMLALGAALWRWWRPGLALVGLLQAADFARLWLPPAVAAAVRMPHLEPLLGLLAAVALVVAVAGALPRGCPRRIAAA